LDSRLSNAMMDYLAVMVGMEQSGKKIRSVDIASALGVRKPSVCNALGKLSRSGCIISDSGREIELTEEGRRLGGEYLERIRVLSEVLVRGGLSAECARACAGHMVHEASDEALRALCRLAGLPEWGSAV